MSDQPKKPSKSSPSRAGYTLTELLVVLVILGLVIGLIGPRFLGQIEVAKGKTVVAQIKNLQTSVEMFYLTTGRLPTTSEGLRALETAPPNITGWTGDYLGNRGKLPDDPWDNPYLYELRADGRFVIRSLGADKKEGGDGKNRDYSSAD